MKNILALFYLTFTVFITSFAQDSTQLKRQPFKLSIAVDRKSTYEEDIQATPYVLPNDVIQLYPGEKVYVEVEQENNVIKNLTAVKEIKDSSKTLIISFAQVAKKNIHQSMMLKVVNPFPNTLMYEARIFLMKQKKWVGTTIIPVQPKLTSFETWTEVITSIALANFNFSPA